MKVLFDHCSQNGRAYADSYGECLIALEPSDNADEIIKEQTKKRQWYEEEYAYPRRITSYTHEVLKFHETGPCTKENETITGDLILFNTHRVYLD
jgi:hypothetical protein